MQTLNSQSPIGKKIENDILQVSFFISRTRGLKYSVFTVTFHEMISAPECKRKVPINVVIMLRKKSILVFFFKKKCAFLSQFDSNAYPQIDTSVNYDPVRPSFIRNIFVSCLMTQKKQPPVPLMAFWC